MQSLRILSELAVVTAKNRQTVIKYKNDQKKNIRMRYADMAKMSEGRMT